MGVLGKQRKSRRLKSLDTLDSLELLGGEILGYGNFGSIIKPGIPCMNLEDTHHVSKIFPMGLENIKKFRHETSPELLNALRRIDPNMERFIYCSDENSEETPCEEFLIKDLCEETRGDLKKLNLESIISTKKLIFFNLPLAVPFGGRLNQKQLDYLKQSVELLHLQNIAHCDIHMANIMSSPGEEGVPKLIDFGEWKVCTENAKKFDDLKIQSLMDKPPQLLKKKREREDKESGGGGGGSGGGSFGGRGGGGGGEQSNNFLSFY